MGYGEVAEEGSALALYQKVHLCEEYHCLILRLVYPETAAYGVSAGFFPTMTAETRSD